MCLHVAMYEPHPSSCFLAASFITYIRKVPHPRPSVTPLPHTGSTLDYAVRTYEWVER